MSAEDRAAIVGSKPPSLRRWRLTAEKGEDVAIGAATLARLRAFMASQPPEHVEDYRRGVRATMVRLRRIMDDVEDELTGAGEIRDARADELDV
jgi:hypothetical protein